MAVVASGKSESLKDAYTPLLIPIFNQSYSSLHSASVCAHPTLPAINACDDSGRESKCVDRDPDALAFRRQHANEVLLDDRRISIVVSNSFSFMLENSIANGRYISEYARFMTKQLLGPCQMRAGFCTLWERHRE